MTFKEFPCYDKPPFDPEGVSEIKYKKKIDRGEFVSHESGEVLKATWWEDNGTKMVDRKSYIKLYKVGQVVLGQLSNAGLIVLLEVMARLKPHQDKVVIRQRDVVKKHKNLKGAGFYKGMCELLEYGALAKTTEQHTYFINSNMFFNGDRLKWLKNNND